MEGIDCSRPENHLQWRVSPIEECKEMVLFMRKNYKKPKVLQMLELKDEKCSDPMSANICTRGIIRQTQGYCSGDSGGPIMSLDMSSGQYEIIGIISQAGSLGSRYAVPCTSTFQQESTRVWEFVKWIQENVNDLP